MLVIFAINFVSGTTTAILVWLIDKSYKKRDRTFQGARERRKIMKWLPLLFAIYAITNIALIAGK
jgi:hypothetical protein